MKALKINVETKEIESINIDSSKDIYKEIGCQLFEIPVVFDNGDGLYCDEEALLKSEDIKGGFIMPGWVMPILGNAIVLGSKKNGDSCSCKTEISDLKIHFFNSEICKKYAKSIGF